jgi:hypothetical protein
MNNHAETVSGPQRGPGDKNWWPSLGPFEARATLWFLGILRSSGLLTTQEMTSQATVNDLWDRLYERRAAGPGARPGPRSPVALYFAHLVARSQLRGMVRARAAELVARMHQLPQPDPRQLLRDLRTLDGLPARIERLGGLPPAHLVPSDRPKRPASRTVGARATKGVVRPRRASMPASTRASIACAQPGAQSRSSPLPGEPSDWRSTIVACGCGRRSCLGHTHRHYLSHSSRSGCCDRSEAASVSLGPATRTARLSQPRSDAQRVPSCPQRSQVHGSALTTCRFPARRASGVVGCSLVRS